MNKRLVFHYRVGRWDVFESLKPWDIREALSITLHKIEEAAPGSISKAAALDDKNFQSNKKRTRRYIADRQDLLYIDSPHLQQQSENVGDHWVVTNIPWRDVSSILELACKAAGIRFGSLSEISF